MWVVTTIWSDSHKYVIAGENGEEIPKKSFTKVEGYLMQQLEIFYAGNERFLKPSLQTKQETHQINQESSPTKMLSTIRFT